MSRRNSLIKFPACLYFSERNLNGSKMAPSINGISVFIAEFESWLSGFPQSPALIVESSSAGQNEKQFFRRLMLTQQDINYLGIDGPRPIARSKVAATFGTFQFDRSVPQRRYQALRQINGLTSSATAQIVRLDVDQFFFAGRATQLF